MRDPLIDRDDAWADFLNGIFLRRIWRQPSTVATSMEVADTSSQRPSTVDRSKAPKAARAPVDKQYGKGPIMQLGEEVRAPAETISTSSIALDLALGIGGLPRGRVVEIYGPESLDTTTLALHVVANAQKDGGNAAFIDAEHGWDPKYAATLGVDPDALLVARPETGEEFLDLLEMLIGSSFDVVVIGPPASLVPHAENKGGSGSGDGALPWRLMTQAIREIAHHLHSTNAIAIFISPLNEKSGVMTDSPDIAGGKALKFYASVRIDVRRIETLKDGTRVTVGNRVRAKIVKNKVAPPFKQAEFDIIYGTGISRESGLIDMGVEHGFVIKSGTRFMYDGVQLGQDRANACKFLRLNPKHADALERRLRGKLEASGNADLTRQILSSAD